GANSGALASYCARADAHLHSFPTRRSSDLTASGMCIRFSETEVRSMGLVAAGVNSIKLKEGDFVVGSSLVSNKDEVALLTRLGRSEEHTSELQSRENIVCRLLLEKNTAAQR